MSRAWMPMYWGDYLADTPHFSKAEHGAYLLLIAYYWCNGGLPDNEDDIRKIAKCDVRQWQHFRRLLQTKFDSSWRHKRVDAELAKAIEKSQVNSANAQRKHKVVADVSPSYSHSHSQERDKSLSTERDKWPKDYREQFWRAYPRKVGKGSALRKLEAIKAGGEIEFDRLIAAIGTIQATEERFIPHPTTWLNQGRYLDLLPPATAAPSNSNGGWRPGLPTEQELREKYAQQTTGRSAQGNDGASKELLAPGVRVSGKKSNGVGTHHAGNGGVQQLGEVFPEQGMGAVLDPADEGWEDQIHDGAGKIP